MRIRGVSGWLEPGARSEIGAPCPDFFPENFQNGRPKTNFGRFKSDKKKTNKQTYKTKIYTHFFRNKLLILNFPLISDQYETNGWSTIFFYQDDFSAPLKWHPRHVPPLPSPSYTTDVDTLYIVVPQQELQVNTVAPEYPQRTLTASSSCNSHSDTETQLHGHRNHCAMSKPGHFKGLFPAGSEISNIEQGFPTCGPRATMRPRGGRGAMT